MYDQVVAKVVAWNGATDVDGACTTAAHARMFRIGSKETPLAVEAAIVLMNKGEVREYGLPNVLAPVV